MKVEVSAQRNHSAQLGLRDLVGLRCLPCINIGSFAHSAKISLQNIVPRWLADANAGRNAGGLDAGIRAVLMPGDFD
jgi:hypothetical protein